MPAPAATPCLFHCSADDCRLRHNAALRSAQLATGGNPEPHGCTHVGYAASRIPVRQLILSLGAANALLCCRFHRWRGLSVLLAEPPSQSVRFGALDQRQWRPRCPTTHATL
jgi:hypothetical protein